MSVEPQPPPARGILSTPPSARARILDGVKHGFFGREGGVSTGIYASLNAGSSAQDDPSNVLENRRRIASAFDIEREQLVGVEQVHSPNAVFISEPWKGERSVADALVTTTPNLAISILTADCAPILLIDSEAGVAGAAHAGWRGAIAGVVENTVALMEKHGAQRDRIAAAIGPCIHQASYEVGPEFEAQFVAADPNYARFFAPGSGDRLHFDLPDFCVGQLSAAGVRHVETLPLDTFAETTKLFSNRRAFQAGEKVFGRNLSGIML